MTSHAVGFIGLGAMGAPMTLNLVEAGHAVTVWNRSPEKLAAALDAGATAAATPAALTEAAKTVCLCVTDTDAVERVVFGPDGVAEGATANKILVDHSTIHPMRSREMAARLRAETGMGWVDAPVSGGAAGAAAGRLVVMAGGAAEDVARVAPVMEAFAQRVTHMGPSGAGQATKTINQMIIGAEVAVIAEAFAFAAKFGVDAHAIPDCLAGGWADSTVLQNHARRMASADYSDPGTARIMLKDMNIASDMGRLTEAAMPVTALVTSLYRLLIEQGHGHTGQIGLMRLYKDGPL